MMQKEKQLYHQQLKFENELIFLFICSSGGKGKTLGLISILVLLSGWFNSSSTTCLHLASSVKILIQFVNKMKQGEAKENKLILRQLFP